MDSIKNNWEVLKIEMEKAMKVLEIERVKFEEEKAAFEKYKIEMESIIVEERVALEEEKILFLNTIENEKINLTQEELKKSENDLKIVPSKKYDLLKPKSNIHLSHFNLFSILF